MLSISGGIRNLSAIAAHTFSSPWFPVSCYEFAGGGKLRTPPYCASAHGPDLERKQLIHKKQAMQYQLLVVAALASAAWATNGKAPHIIMSPEARMIILLGGF